MRPLMYRTCTNDRCDMYDKEIALSDEKCVTICVSCFCPSCHQEGRLRVFHNGIEADSVNTFYAIAGGMAKEFHVLKKLVARDVADEEDKKRYQEILEKIRDLECTGCGQMLIDHEH